MSAEQGRITSSCGRKTCSAPGSFVAVLLKIDVALHLFRNVTQLYKSLN